MTPEGIDDVKGYLPDDEGETLADLASRCEGPALEVGTYCGKSTVWIGQAVKARGEVLFTVDTHRGSPEMREGNDCYDPDVIGPDGHDTFPFLRQTLTRYDLEQTVIPIVGDSQTVGRYWRLPVGFCFIDACHNPIEVTLDAALFATWVTDTLVLHDASIPHIGHVGDSLFHQGWTDEGMSGCMRILTR